MHRPVVASVLSLSMAALAQGSAAPQAPVLKVDKGGAAIRVRFGAPSREVFCEYGPEKVSAAAFIAEFTEEMTGVGVAMVPPVGAIHITDEKGAPLAGKKACLAKNQSGFLTFKPGRYLITPVPGSDDAVYKSARIGTFVIRPKDASPLVKVAEAPEANLPEAHRALNVWFPAVSWKTLAQDDALRAQVFKTAPKELFVYAQRDLTKDDAEVLPLGAIASTDSNTDTPPPGELPKAGEPLVLAEAGMLTFLGVDGSPFKIRQSALAQLQPRPPASGVVLPAAVRNTWAPLETLLASATSKEDKAAVEQFHKLNEKTRVCLANATGKFSKATENVIITPAQRDAASARLDKDRAACKPEATAKQRDQLRERLLKASSVGRQKAYEELKPALEPLFGAPAR